MDPDVRSADAQGGIGLARVSLSVPDSFEKENVQSSGVRLLSSTPQGNAMRSSGAAARHEIVLISAPRAGIDGI
jgi:hypothetical protein